jgi:hypothetical protein
MKKILLVLLLAAPAMSAEKKVPSQGTCQVSLDGDIKEAFTRSLEGADVTADQWMMPNAPMPLAMFHIDCGNKSDVNLSIWPSSDSTQKDVPLGPKTYPIKNGNIQKSPGPGVFTVNLHIGKEKVMPSFTVVPQPGSIQLTQFDAKGMAGKFSFAAIEDGGSRKVSVSGTFKYARR